MKPQFRWLAGLLPAATIFGTVEVCAEPTTFYFEGHVNFIHDYLELDESVYLGAPFSGGYVFDSAGVSDIYPNNPNVGSYYFGAAGRMWARIGNYEFTTVDLGILILNDTIGGDLYEPISFAVSDTAGYQWLGMLVYLSDETGRAMDSDALFLGVPRLSDFPSETSFGIFLPGDDLGIGGTLTSLTPEPGSLVLFALGALAVSRGKENR